MNTLAFKVLAISLLLGCPLAAQMYPVPPPPDIRITVPNLVSATAPDSDPSSVAKAALAIVLSGLGLTCDPDSQLEDVVGTYAGGSLKTLVSKISGTSCEIDVHLLRVTASYVPNAQIQGDNIVASVNGRKPLLIQWENNLYVLYGVVFYEYTQPAGEYGQEVGYQSIRKLLLIDPRYSDQRRFIAFVRGKDDFTQIEGIASLGVSQR